jgi:hypothetical protein
VAELGGVPASRRANLRRRRSEEAVGAKQGTWRRWRSTAMGARTLGIADAPGDALLQGPRRRRRRRGRLEGGDRGGTRAGSCGRARATASEAEKRSSRLTRPRGGLRDERLPGRGQTRRRRGAGGARPREGGAEEAGRAVAARRSCRDVEAAPVGAPGGTGR